MKSGKFFKYPEPNSTRIFELDKIDGFIYIFKCGHRVTDSVFEDLIYLKTGKAETGK